MKREDIELGKEYAYQTSPNRPPEKIIVIDTGKWTRGSRMYGNKRAFLLENGTTVETYHSRSVEGVSVLACRIGPGYVSEATTVSISHIKGPWDEQIAIWNESTRKVREEREARAAERRADIAQRQATVDRLGVISAQYGVYVKADTGIAHGCITVDVATLNDLFDAMFPIS